MKRSLFRVQRTTCLFVLATSFFFLTQIPLHGQDPSNIGYRVFWPNVPADSTFVEVRDFSLTTDLANGNVDYAMVVGYSDNGTKSSGFVYDYTGVIDPDATFSDPNPGSPNDPIEKNFWSIEQLVGPITAPSWIPDTHVDSLVNGINPAGRIVGYAAGQINGQWDRVGFYIDLLDPVLQLKPLDPVGQKVSGSSIRVNELGEILFSYNNQPYLFDPASGAKIQLPFQLRPGSPEKLFFNSARGEILAERDDSMVIRHTIGGGTQEFPNANDPQGINEYGQFICVNWIPKGRNKGWYAARISGENDTVEWNKKNGDIGTIKNFALVADLNNSGDVVNGDNGDGEVTNYLFHEGDPSVSGDEIFVDDIDSLVINDSDPNGYFRNALIRHQDLHLSDRDIATNFGWMTGVTYEGSFFLLIPEDLADVPNAGIDVSPKTGLVTTESGGTDSFDIVLNAEPTGDVTIGISSSNTAEGTVSTGSLTFTPANWDTPQSVTITGVDDALDDGDVAYTIYTAAAISTDPNYNGLDADNVGVTNLDDEQAPTVTYDSDVTQNEVDIPDQGMATSTITVGPLEDYLIDKLTVRLTINHERVQDLDVLLIGPDATIELFSDVGGNGVNVDTTLDDDAATSIANGTAPFNGSFRPEVDRLSDFIGFHTEGQWTLVVYDDKRNKIGEIVDWSFTVEY